MKLSFVSFAATVALTNAATMSIPLRGSNTKQEENAVRNLQASPPMNEGSCAPHTSGDGSVQCNTRFDPNSPTPTTTYGCTDANNCYSTTTQKVDPFNVPCNTATPLAPCGGGLGADNEQAETGPIDDDKPPAMDGDYQSEDYKTNPEGMCIVNGVGATCTNTNFPSIACCTNTDTGGFFNACCVADFQGIQFGGYEVQGTMQGTNEFDVMIQGTVADCVNNGNNQGCAVLETPGNQPSTPVANHPPYAAGPCVEATPGTQCPSHGGTCTGPDNRQFSVCCPECATGTYQIGDSCKVTLPDPAACGFGNIPGGGSTPVAPPIPGVTPVPPNTVPTGSMPVNPVPAVVVPTAPAPTPTTNSGSSPTVPVRGDGDNNGMRPANESGNKGPGQKCTSDSECIMTAFCGSTQTCYSMGSCQLDSDCTNDGNKFFEPTCPGTVECVGVICSKKCNVDDNWGGPSGGSTPSGGNAGGNSAAPFNGQTYYQGQQLCPVNSVEAENRNCCQFLNAPPGVGVESQCTYGSMGATSGNMIQCRCAGQMNDAGISDCETLGWQCRDVEGGSLDLISPFQAF